MINFNFLPSRRLSQYMAKLFITRSLAVLVALVLVLMTLDLLGESGKILKVPGNGEAQLWHYVALRLPLLVQKFLPFSVLLGTLISFTALNQHSEITSMKAAGLSAHQILAPMILASMVLAVLTFVFNETVAVPSQRAVNAWQDNDYKPVDSDGDMVTNAWLRNGDQLIHASHIGYDGGMHLEGVTIYDRRNGALSRITDVKRATPGPDNVWDMQGIQSYDVGGHVLRKSEAAKGLAGIAPERFTLAKVDPTEKDFLTLRRAIDGLNQAGRPSEEATTGWWHKLSGPLSTVLMPLLAAMAAFGLARSGKTLLRATAGMALGFAYFVVDNVSVALGNVGAYPPMLAAWAPFFLFLLIGETVLVRSEE